MAQFTPGLSGISSYFQRFDVQGYLNANPDVKKAILQRGDLFGAQRSKYKGYYKIDDSDSIFTPEAAAAINHYRQFGMNEGRTGGGENFGGVYSPSSQNNSGNNSGNKDSSSSNSNNSSISGGLFGNTGGYLGTGVSFDDYVNKMKELTDWRLGIDKRSMENAYGFRNQEANRDFGFNTQLAGQQIQGQKDIQGQQIEGTKNLETLRNEYMNTRQREQLENQRNMQQAGFNQQNKLLTDNANRARSLYFGGR